MRAESYHSSVHSALTKPQAIQYHSRKMKLSSTSLAFALICSSAAATSAPKLRGRNHVRSLEDNATDDSLFDESVVYCIADVDFTVTDDNVTAIDGVDGNFTGDYEEYPYEMPLCSELDNATKGVSCIEDNQNATDIVDGNLTGDDSFDWGDDNATATDDIGMGDENATATDDFDFSGNFTGDLEDGVEMGDDNATAPEDFDVDGNYTVDDEAAYGHDLPLCSELDNATKAKAVPIYRK